jgi:DNA repair exonuclease SbcCD ATPase subunit
MTEAIAERAKLPDLAEITQQLVQCREQIVQSGKRQKQQQQQQIALEALQAASATLGRLPPVADVQRELDRLTELGTEQSKKQGEVNLKLQLHTMLAGAGEFHTCPVCDQTVDNMSSSPKVLKELQDKMAQWEATLAETRAAWSAQKELLSQHALYSSEMRRLAVQVQTETQALQNLPALPSEDELLALRGRLETSQAQILEVAARVETHTARVAGYTASLGAYPNWQAIKDTEVLETAPLHAKLRTLRQAETDLVELVKAYTAACSSADHTARARVQNLAEHDDCKVKLLTAKAFPATLQEVINRVGPELSPVTELQALQNAYLLQFGSFNESVRNSEELQRRQMELEVRMDKDKARRSLLATMETVRDAYHRTGVPLAYMRRKFERLCVLTCVNLEKLDSSFTVESDPENPVTFLFRRTDDPTNYVMSQSKLSGGQRVRLTVAFLMALQQLILPEVSFLVLDEPSVHLDQPGVESLRDLLVELGQHLQSGEAQVIVCDHNEALQPSFQNVIRLT